MNELDRVLFQDIRFYYHPVNIKKVTDRRSWLKFEDFHKIWMPKSRKPVFFVHLIRILK